GRVVRVAQPEPPRRPQDQQDDEAADDGGGDERAVPDAEGVLAFLGNRCRPAQAAPLALATGGEEREDREAEEPGHGATTSGHDANPNAAPVRANVQVGLAFAACPPTSTRPR